MIKRTSLLSTDWRYCL